MIQFKQKTYSEGDRLNFLQFLGIISGFLCKAKNLHWASPKMNIHKSLDEFHEILDKYQDAIAEGYMGILGQMGPDDVPYIPCHANDAMSFISEVLEKTKEFYSKIPEGTEFKGIVSETDSFIQDLGKYHYLFGLCNNDFEKNDTSKE